MRKITVLVCALIAGSLTVSAAAKRHTIKFFGPTDVNGVELKPGEYDVALEGGTAVFYRGRKEVAKAPAHEEQNAKKYDISTIVYRADQRVLNEIRIGGSTTKLVLTGASATTANP
jgi:hypothetical protein